MRTYAFFSILSVALMAAAPFANGQNTWQPLAGPKGISVEALAATDDGKVYLGSLYGGIYRTTDDGETWEPFNAGLTINTYGYGIDLATAPDGKVYLIYDSNLFQLSGSGNSWQQLSLPNSVSAEEIFTNPQGDLFATNYSGDIYRSTDDGNSFSLFVASAALGWSSGEYDFHGNGHNFVITYNYIYRISDDGSQVTQIYNNSGSPYTVAYHVPSGRVFYSDGYLRYSADDGTTWQDVTILPGEPYQPYVTDLIVEPSGDLIASSYEGHFRSQDGGSTWSLLNAPFGSFGGDLQMAFTASSIFASNTDCNAEAFTRSTDNWATWENLESKFSNPIVYAIYKDPSGNLYAQTCDYELQRSSDGGGTWQPFMMPNGQLVQQVTNNSLGHLFAVASDSLYRSTDVGATWANITPNDAWFYYNKIIVGAQNELYFYSDYEYDALKSLDNGETWQLVSFPQNAYFSGVSLHPDGSFYMTDLFAGIWRSSDGWQTWEQVLTLEADFYSIHINSKGHIYFYMDDFINSNSGLFVSFDNLNTYQSINTNIYGGTIVSDAEGDVYITDGNGITYTEDDGMTWQAFNDGLSNPQLISALYVDDEQHLYAGFTGDVVYKTSLPVAARNSVRGKVWFDENENCLFDPGEQPLAGWLIKAEGSSDDYYRSTGYNGHYVLGLPSGSYSVNATLPNALWENTCSPQGVNVSFSGSWDTAYVDFPIAAAQLCPLLSIDFSTPLLRRCFDNTYSFKVCNEGTAAATNATVEVVLDSLLIFQSATAPVVSQSGNTYTFSVGDIGVEDCNYFQVIVKVSCEAEIGETHCVEARLPQGPCPAILPAVSKECQANIGSFDPNDKTALVGGLPEAEWVNPNTDLEYHIRFQNTGTDTAFTVVVEDQLSPLLDPATVRPGASSHPYTFELSETGMLRFVFANILLPDSNINEAASHGFLKFAVSQRSNAPFGNYIENFAAIFFDFNEPVLTNNVKLHVGDPTATHERQQRYTVTAYPNPFQRATRLKISGLDGQQLQLMLFDARGALLRQSSFVAPEVDILRNGLIEGMYFFGIEKEGEIVGRGKLVVK